MALKLSIIWLTNALTITFVSLSSPEVRDNFVVVTEYDIVKMVMAKNFSAAYAVPLKRAKFILNSPNMRENNVPVFHIIAEPLGKPRIARNKH